MPIPILSQVITDGIQSVPYIRQVLLYIPWLLVVLIIKYWFNGTKNGNERVMHSKVAIVTGGTSGIGAAVVDDLASRGTQLILLVRDASSIFTADYIHDLRAKHNNQLIYAETCDLENLHSVRLFATKFIDNSPPRRVDMVVCCAGVMAPPGAPRTTTADGVESHWGLNYLSHFHLLTLLEPVLKVQPPDRDVRILLATCSSYLLGDLDLNDVQFLKRKYPLRQPWKTYGASKMALMAFTSEWQRRLWQYKRPDGEEMNVRVFSVDPGIARTPGSRRWLSFGSLWGLGAYLLTWPFWWIVLKDPLSAAQSFFTALMSPECAQGHGGYFIKECKLQGYRKEGLDSEDLGKQLWELSELMIKDLEKESAKKRAAEKSKTKTKKSGEQVPGEPRIKEEPDEDVDKNVKENIEKRLRDQTKKRQLLDKLIKEEEAKAGGKFDLPDVLPDERVAPAKAAEEKAKVRSRSKNRVGKTPETKALAPPSDTPARNTRSQSRARESMSATPAPAPENDSDEYEEIGGTIQVQTPTKKPRRRKV